MEIEYSKPALKALKGMDKAIRDRIVIGLCALTETPPRGDIKALQGRAGSFRLRIGKFRVLYKYEGNTLKVDDIGSRGDIYK